MKSLEWLPLTSEKEPWVFASSIEEDAERGCIGHLRGDFGSSGKEFWTTWFDHQPALKTGDFVEELQGVVNALRKKNALLSSFVNMRLLCHAGHVHDDCFSLMAESERYTYCLRCIPRRGDYNFYLYAFDKGAQAT